MQLWTVTTPLSAIVSQQSRLNYSHSITSYLYTSEYGGQEFFKKCAEERETTPDEIID